ncbi:MULTISPECIES: envelope stress response protein PspG [Vibrio]|jgi:phage shock protein G|uniref:Envelope stress response protein PspG n=1 Tax=Vibrio mediterranei TaxID=689 RepID=A0AAJ3BLK9_9VIBR|nr:MULTISPECIES: envelope stress response protein PspG [Vibrio]ASI89113.1 phage shock protein G [Vibrio mediterranei]EDL52585.1 tRNA-dihydrouridine synthase A [Vibrio mediterranei AK1]MCF4176771.1 envelope stress response protein PspG [Vibrio sp. McD22-P3]MCG9627907.1 envelope stress response protein PspG [Vibrio mediterranei]MCG9656786.1 envelope stress response protein PspG [Vibrio mediterranei]
MFELIFVLVFLATLVMTGVTVMTVTLAVVVSFGVMFMLGMVGIVFNLLPYIIAFLIAIWLYKKVVAPSS